MSLTRRDLLAASATSLVTAACSHEPGLGQNGRTKAPPPNLLLIVSDDQSIEDVACYGNATIGTPGIDRLAGEGLSFTRAFTPTAICQPSRGAIHTGLYGTSSGADGFAPIKPGIATLSTVLKTAGYLTALIGKTHLEPIKQFQFDLLKPSDELSSGRDVDAFARCARSFVKECASARHPFFLTVNFDDPHWPWPLTPEEARDALRRGLRFANGIDPRDLALGNVAGMHDPKKVRLPALLPDRPEVRDELARYADGITRLDRGVGLVLDVVEQEKLAENTVVVFLSDNGMDFPFHKTTLWEGGVHLPLIVRWPGVTPPGATCDGMVSFVDLMPTFVEIAGASAPGHLDGRSFSAALGDPKAPLRDEVFLTHTRHRQDVPMPSRGLRTTRFKYLRNFWPAGISFLTRGMNHASWEACEAAAKEDPILAERIDRYLHRPPIELYDLQSDPFEEKNLAGVPDYSIVQTEMETRLKAAMASIADPLTEKL